MPRKRAKPRKQPKQAFVDQLDANVDRNPLTQPAGSVWTKTRDDGAIELWGCHEDDSMVSAGMGVMKGAGVFAVVWEVPLGDRSGEHAVVASPWNHRPIRVYGSVSLAVEQEKLRWKVTRGYM